MDKITPKLAGRVIPLCCSQKINEITVMHLALGWGEYKYSLSLHTTETR